MVGVERIISKLIRGQIVSRADNINPGDDINSLMVEKGLLEMRSIYRNYGMDEDMIDSCMRIFKKDLEKLKVMSDNERADHMCGYCDNWNSKSGCGRINDCPSRKRYLNSKKVE